MATTIKLWHGNARTQEIAHSNVKRSMTHWLT